MTKTYIIVFGFPHFRVNPLLINYAQQDVHNYVNDTLAEKLYKRNTHAAAIGIITVMHDVIYIIMLMTL